jgi:hypothetical protein
VQRAESEQSTVYNALQIKSGDKELYEGSLNLPEDWYLRRDPIREQIVLHDIVLHDITCSAKRYNGAVDTRERAHSRLPVVSVEVCVLRIRASRKHDDTPGVHHEALEYATEFLALAFAPVKAQVISYKNLEFLTDSE